MKVQSDRYAFSSVIVILILAAISFGGCKGKTAEDNRTAQPEKVSVCIIGAAGITTTLAHENGMFAKQGIDLTIKKSSSGQQALDSMLKGECDLSTPTETSFVLKNFENREFSILATTATSVNSLRILANRKSGIARPQDLKGKRIFTPKGSVGQYFLDMFLVKHGLSKSDITLVTTGVPDVSAAFRDGRIDAYSQTDVMTNKAWKALGGDAVVMTEPGLCRTTFNIAATNRFIRQRPETVRKILAALLEGERILTQEPGKAGAAVRNVLDLDKDSVAGILANYDWTIGINQTLVLSLEHVARWAIESGISNTATMPNYLDYIHTEALRALRPEAVTLIK